MPSSHLILSSPSPPAPDPSQHQSLSQWVNSSHEVAKYWSFSFSIIPSKEIPGLISVRMDWLDLLAVQGTLKSFLQHHSSKASILWRSAFFTVQLSHPYMTKFQIETLKKKRGGMKIPEISFPHTSPYLSLTFGCSLVMSFIISQNHRYSFLNCVSHSSECLNLRRSWELLVYSQLVRNKGG